MFHKKQVIHFKNKYMKINCWAKIGEVFGMTAADAEAKFNNLRSAYTRFKKKRKTFRPDQLEML